MAEEEIERNWKDWLRIILPRILEATAWALITWAVFLALELIGKLLPIEYEAFTLTAWVFIAFEFVIHLLSRTIFSPALEIAMEFVFIIILLVFTDGGAITTIIPLEGIAIQATLEFRPVLAAFLVLSLLSIARNVFQIFDFLSEADEEPEKIT
jgi:hypothetical protein